MTEYYRITMEDYERYLYKIKNTPKPKSKKALKNDQKTKAIINHNGDLRKKLEVMQRICVMSLHH